MIKNSGFRIRVQRDLREQFVDICRAQDKPAAQVLREYMRLYVEKHKMANDDGAAVSKKRKKQNSNG